MLLFYFPKKAAVFALALFITACTNYAEYSLQAYTYATEAKAKTLKLVSKANGSYSANRAAAEALLLDMDVAYEFANGIENNEEAAQIWDKLRDPDGNLVGGFLSAWRTEFPGGVSADSEFIKEFKKNITFSFDRLICLEANKGEATACADVAS